MKKLAEEFKAFIMRGNVLDMAVGVIIATAFGAITNSLVNDVVMPLIGMLFGGLNPEALNITLKEAVLDASGEVVQEAVVIGIGTFIGTIINFILVALVVFCVIKAINSARKKMEKKAEEAAEEAPPEPSAEEKLLTEIRDLLEAQKKG